MLPSLISMPLLLCSCLCFYHVGMLLLGVAPLVNKSLISLNISLHGHSLCKYLIKRIQKSFDSFMIIVALPLSYHANNHVDHCGDETTPSFFQKYSKFSVIRGLVKISAICYFFPTYSTLMFLDVTYSHGICFFDFT
jgi:hypothetical protein